MATAMNMLRLQKRLAFRVLRYGEEKVWLNPNETSEIAKANSHQQIRKLIKDRLIIRKPMTVHSRARCQENTLAYRKGRHMGIGVVAQGQMFGITKQNIYVTKLFTFH
ncbi:hypothetical protein H8959_005273 [Pygathrix nigripes]